MAIVTLRGNPVRTSGELPKVGSVAPAFTLVDRDLKDVGLGQYAGKTKVLNVFPSIDTATCATSVRKFNEKAGMFPNLKVLCISADLPFAMKRFCIAEKLDHVEILSLMRGREFAETYGLRLLDGPLAGLTARACLVLGPDNLVLHAELVPEIAHEPDYDAALAAVARVAN